MAQRVGRGIALLFHYRGTSRGWVVNATPRPYFTTGKDRVPIFRKLGGPQGRSGRAENLFPTGIRSRWGPVHETATYRCDDTRGCVTQFWPPDDEHMCSKHVAAWNKLIVKQKFCASSWLITEINILRCTVSKTSKFYKYVCAFYTTRTMFTQEVCNLWRLHLWRPTLLTAKGHTCYCGLLLGPRVGK